jgi:hypothetical protein
MNQHQQAVIEFLQEENRVLLEQLGGKSRRFSDAQRVRLARRAKLVGRRRLGQITKRLAAVLGWGGNRDLRPEPSRVPLTEKDERKADF